MSKVKHTDHVWSPHVETRFRKWSIELDRHLRLLLEHIEDPDEQMTICEVFCTIGLVERRLFGENTDTFVSHEYHYTSTKPMRKLAKEWLYSD